MAAALAIRMDEYLAHPPIVARRVWVVEPLAAIKASDASRMERIGEIGGADFLEGLRSRDGRAAPTPRRWLGGLPRDSLAALHRFIPASVLRPASVIRNTASILRLPAVTRCGVAVASPARTSATICSTVKPWATRMVCVQPSCGQSASNSSARRRSGLGRRERPALAGVEAMAQPIANGETGHHARQRAREAELGATNRHRSLRALCERAGLTPGKLAERLGVTPHTIQSWEKGERPVRKVWRFKLADALGCSVADVRQAEEVARSKR
jgi:DNA-binding XRE family transcriptional regulator